jgi:hypothetical protein
MEIDPLARKIMSLSGMSKTRHHPGEGRVQSNSLNKINSL